MGWDPAAPARAEVSPLLARRALSTGPRSVVSFPGATAVSAVRRRPRTADTAVAPENSQPTRARCLDVVDLERLVRDEQDGDVAVVGGAVLHDRALGEPDEAARAEPAGVRDQRPVQDIHAVGARVRVPDVDHPGRV